MKLERRDTPAAVELRADGDDEMPRIRGYAAVFYRAGDASTEYELWPGAVERIMPGAFDGIDDDDVRAMFDHHLLLGRRAAGTLRVEVDDVGLRYEIEPSDTQAYRDTAEHVRLRNVTGSSFSFRLRGKDGEAWSHETRDGKPIETREIRSVSVFDVGPVVNPAYVGTTAGARAAGDSDEARSSHAAWKAAEKLRCDAIAADRAKLDQLLARSILTQSRLSQ